MPSMENTITEADWLAKKVDMRCKRCGATSAGSARCYACNSRDIELRTHAQTPRDEGLWCGAGLRRVSGTPGRPLFGKGLVEHAVVDALLSK
jgi:hypothetical protein